MRNLTLVPIVLLVAGSLLVLGCEKEESPPATPTEAEPAEQIQPAPEPVTPPAETPQPEAEPEPQPEPQPEPKPEPAAELKVEPASEPKPLQPVERAETPWTDAKVGTMVKMKGMGGTITTMEVIKVDEDTATVKMTVATAEMEPIVTEIPMPRYAPADKVTGPSATRGRKAGTETIEVAGAELVCEVWESTSTMGERTVTTRTYNCKEVPGWTVRIENDMTGEMQTISEVIEYSK